MKFEKYPDEMLIMHLQAQIDRVLDYEFGSIVSNSEYRGLGKTTSIIRRVYYGLLQYGLDSKENIVFVDNVFQQEEYVKELVRLIDSSHLPEIERDRLSKAKLKKIILVANENLRGYRLADETTIVYIDGVSKNMYDLVVKPTCSTTNTVVRGFVRIYK